MKNVLITGHNGYIGPHMIDVLRSNGGFNIFGCDINLFSDVAWRELPIPDVEWIKDFRELTEKDLAQIDTVVHLAAISNDPMGELNPDITLNINGKGTVEFAKLCKAAGVKKFLMSSSCSIYGKSEKMNMVETDNTDPLTTYAKSKIHVEEHLYNLGSGDFCVRFLRNSTAYGDSPNLRIDLVVNNFLACAVARNELRIMSDGTPWRPLIHCRDIANAFALFIDAPNDLINKQVVNIGANDQNFQVSDVAKIAQDIFPGCILNFTGEAVNDSRDYKVNFDKFTKMFPDFSFEYNLKTGMKELAARLVDFNFSAQDFDGEQFVRLKIIAKKLDLIAA
jgi:nucleoside-diphosphate-sugar epimerase